jgi:hypothetical protein
MLLEIKYFIRKIIQMKLLISGCSFSSGWGFNVDNIHQHWPNQIAKKLNADLVNVSAAGYDNQGIFLNFIRKIVELEFDLCLLQVTDLTRVVLSPNVHGYKLVNQTNISNDLLTDAEYWDWYKKFAILNQGMEHWERFINIVCTIQELVKQGKKIKFVNGLLSWDRELFEQPTKSKFIQSTIDFDNIIDSDIDKFTKIMYNQAQTIDLDLWINPFVPLNNLQVDMISISDPHPGLKSQQIFTDLIYKGITHA